MDKGLNLKSPHHFTRRSFLASLAVLGGMPAISLGGCSEPSATYCDPSRFGDVFVIIDRTTKFTAEDQLIVHQTVQQVLERLSPGQRLQLSTISDSQVRRVIFDHCVPGCNDSQWSRLVSQCNAARVPAQLDAIRRELTKVMTEVLDVAEDYKHSEVFATIAATAAARRSVPAPRLIVIGDHIENSTHIPARLFVDARRAELVWQRLQDRGLIVDFSGWDVILVGLGRYQVRELGALPLETVRHIKSVYRKYFQACGAATVKIGATYETATLS